MSRLSDCRVVTPTTFFELEACMDDSVQVGCTRCKSIFGDRARRVQPGYSSRPEGRRRPTPDFLTKRPAQDEGFA
jgi:hypothetical protein